MLAAMAPALTALTLASSSVLGPRPAARLASLTALRELAVLDDDGCGGLGPEEAASIAGLRHLRHLRLLHQERLGCRGAALLSALSAVTELDVRGADLATLAVVECLATLRALRKLDISWNGLDAAMVAGLAPLTALRELQLRESPALGAAGHAGQNIQHRQRGLWQPHAGHPKGHAKKPQAQGIGAVGDVDRRGRHGN